MNPYFKLPPLHDWQTAALATLTAVRASGAKDFLAVVSVGGGKTRFALEAAAAMLTSGEISRVIILTNTTHLVKQWGRAATQLGIKLIQAFGNKELADGMPTDCSGYICTYASMGSWPALHEAYAGGAKTLIIFDEIHHLADQDRTDPNEKTTSLWGDKAKECFANVHFRIALSGTPFRTKGDRLPFVQYVESKDEPGQFECKPDYHYRYGNAVTDEICRQVLFKSYDAEPDWNKKIVFRESGVDYNLTFADQVEDPAVIGARLWAASDIGSLDPIPSDLATAKWQLLIGMLRDADRKLQDIRSGDHPDAAGIIICTTADQAKGVQSLLRRITKSKSVLVLHEDPKSAGAIDAFKEGTTPWIIAVRMVSEGVDIPRLRVCVYASYWTALVHFMQVLGRIVRYPKQHPAEPYGESYFYFPADDRLKAYAKKVEDELKQFLRDKRGPKLHEGGGGKPQREVIHAAGDEKENIAAGTAFDPSMIESADEARRDLGLDRISLVELLRFWQRVEEGPRARDAGKTTQSYSEERENLRIDCQRAVGRLSYLTGQPHDQLHRLANDQSGIRKLGKATIEQLQRKLAWLREQIVVAGGNANLSEQDGDEQ